MAREVKLSRVETALSELSYPISRADASDELEGVTLLFADGDGDLGNLIAQTKSDRYVSVQDLETSLHNALPREAVGEPYQSEGEG